MSVRRRQKRPRKANKRVDMSALIEALGLQGDRVFPCLGIVTDEDVDTHFQLTTTDLLIEVELIPGEERITARMGIGGAGSGQGIWFIPPVGTEVAVMVPEGEMASGPVIIGVLSTGLLPSGIADGTTVICNSTKVLIHDGAGPTEPLVKKSEHDGHTHGPGSFSNGGGGVTGTSGGASAVSGTSSLEVK